MRSYAVMFAILAVACGTTSADLPVATTTTTGGVSNQPGGLNAPQGLHEGPPRIILGDDAAAQLASVQCIHEDGCGNTGPAGMFPTFDACVGAIHTSQRNRFAVAECAKGVDPYALEQCLEEERTLGCNASPTSCGNARLCR